MLALYLLFWLQLNLAQTLPLALGLGLFTAGMRGGGGQKWSDAGVHGCKSCRCEQDMPSVCCMNSDRCH
jgi:hypothetical protein